MRTIHQIAKSLFEILGSQDAVAEVLGVGQPNVHAYLKSEDASSDRPVLVLGDRVLTEASVRLDWVVAFLTLASSSATHDLELTRTAEIIESGGGREPIDREIEVFPVGTEANWRAVATEAAKELVANYLAWGFATDADRFAFYRRDDEDLLVVTFTVRGDVTGEPAPMPGDPIFGG